ncbi:retrotransposon protein, putative, ty1-copia subclass [Tanacetum coccineum]
MIVIEHPIPPAPVVDSEANVLAEWNAIYDAYNEDLRSMFEKQARVKRIDLIQTFHACKQEEDKPADAYVLKMKGYVEQLEHLGYVLSQDLSVGLILNGLTSDFARFVSIYSLHNMGKMIGELHAMLIEYEKGLPKKAEIRQVMMIKDGKIQKANKKLLKAKGKAKANGKGKDKQVYITKPKNPKPSAKEHPAKDDTCHHCKEVGHWKRNYPVYLTELLKKKKQLDTASSTSIFTIELFSFLNKSWVMRENQLAHNVPYMKNYDGTECLGYVLDHSHRALVMKKGLPKKAETPQVMMIKGGKIQKSNKKSLKAKGKGKANGKGKDKQVYIPKPKNPKPSAKEHPSKDDTCHHCKEVGHSKHNLDSTYLWHCRLAHKSKKHMEKLQQEGLSKSTNDESFDQCSSCLSCKMTRKSFPHRPERVTGLLGIIHTDLCGPLRHVSRQGDSYFITFTDDYSRYGYVYLLKHKHEVFETFKVFKNEVENQLGKTIKAFQ